LCADTNIFIRFLTNDPPKQANRVRNLFESLKEKGLELFVSDLVVAEVAYVLESVYGAEKGQVSEALMAIAELDNVIMENRTIVLDAIAIYQERGLDFTDAYVAAHMKKSECRRICTFDGDFKKLDFIAIARF
jgi:predicted nucleic acid-binding protein